jgi:branched-chain amino acid transport system ATP-binding protein
MPFLEVRALTHYFGGLAALSEINLDVFKGEVLGIIGPNGAGKSTFFNVVCGNYAPTQGRVIFGGEDITGRPSHVIAKKGISRTFQLTSMVPTLSVLDNMRVGFHLRTKLGFFGALFNPPSVRARGADIDRRAMEILSFVGMEHLIDVLGQNLSQGYHKTLAVAMALAVGSELLLLDEPATALNPERMHAMMGLIRRIRDHGTTVLLVEHNMRTVFGLCDRIVVFDHGVKIAEGPPEEIAANKKVIKAYLGKQADVL